MSHNLHFSFSSSLLRFKIFFRSFFSLDQTALGPISIRNIFRSFSLKNWFLEYGNLQKIYWKIARSFVFEKMRFSNSSFFAGFKLMGAPFRPYKFSLISLICQNSSNNANIFICILSILLQLISPLFNKVAWDFKQKWRGVSVTVFLACADPWSRISFSRRIGGMDHAAW